MIDTDFEYGLQSTKWETIELTNNIPTFFTRNGDQSINLTSVDVNSGSTLVKVSTELDHNLLRGSPIYIKGTNSILADGGFIVKNVTYIIIVIKKQANYTLNLKINPHDLPVIKWTFPEFSIVSKRDIFLTTS